MNFSIKLALKNAWALFLDNAGLLISVYVTVFIVNGLINYVVQTEHVVINFFWQIICSLIALWLMMGQLAIGLNLVDGQRPPFSQLFSTTKPFFSFIITAFLFNLMTLVGLCLLVVPGIIIAIRFGFAFFIVLDKNASPIEALKESARITKGQGWNLFGFDLVLLLIIFAGFCALFFGLFVALPICLLASAHVYRALSRNHIIEPEIIISE